VPSGLGSIADGLAASAQHLPSIPESGAAGGPYQDTRTVIVVHDDRIIAERYATGYGPNSRMQSWSMAKSITDAMIGESYRLKDKRCAGIMARPQSTSAAKTNAA
jgi:hypothetical protein